MYTCEKTALPIETIPKNTRFTTGRSPQRAHSSPPGPVTVTLTKAVYAPALTMADRVGATTDKRFRVTVAYDGTAFHGWQKQVSVPGHEPLRTVAGVLEEALRHVLRQRLDLVGASRTDAGVHAKGQVAHFVVTDTTIPIERLAQAINSRLPEDVEVLAVEPAPSHFDAISDAVSKQYRYRVFHTARRPLNKRHYVWHCWTPLDTDRMADGASRLTGTHDFAGFAAAGHGRASTIRTVLRCDIFRDNPEIHIVVEGTGFLYNMVRIIAGTLVEIGRGRFEPDVIDHVLQSRDRRAAGPTLPARGLCLEWIRYPDQ